MAVQSDHELGAMWADVRMLTLEVASPRRRQCTGKLMIGTPPGTKLELDLRVQQAQSQAAQQPAPAAQSGR